MVGKSLFSGVVKELTSLVPRRRARAFVFGGGTDGDVGSSAISNILENSETFGGAYKTDCTPKPRQQV